MSEQRPLKDDDLHAYLDGQLDDAGVLAIEAAIAQDAEIANKIASFRAQRVAIKQLYDPVLDEPVPDHLRKVVRDARRGARRQTMMRIAASVVFLVVGAAGGWFANAYFASQDFLLEPFVREAVLAHELAITEKPKGLTINKTDEDNLSPSYLPADFGVPVKLPTLRRSELHPVALASGTGSKGSRVTVTYADRQDRRRTLFIRKFSAGNNLPVKYRTTDGFPVLYWLDGPLVYILVGEGDRKELISIAEEIYRTAAVGALPSPTGQMPQRPLK